MSKYHYLILTPLLIILGSSSVFADWQGPNPPGGSINTTNTSLPINVSIQPQIKEGPLTLYQTLWLQGAGSKLFVDDKVQIGPEFSTNPPPTSPAVLDINGRIRIRGGINGAPVYPTVKVLMATSTDGLASWQAVTPGLASLFAGYGIKFTGPATSTTISIEPTQTQRKISGACPTYNGIVRVKEDGTVDCLPIVSQITVTGSGLTTSGSGMGVNGGPVNLALNLASNGGLSVNGSGKLQVNVPATTGDGLQIDILNNLTIENCDSGNPFLKWDNVNSKWSCAPNPPPVTPIPGGSVMKIRASTLAALSNCPAAGLGGASTAWLESPQGSGLTYTYNEYVSAGTTYFNYSRICYKTNQSCQVIYLAAPTSPAPNCPASFYDFSERTVHPSPGTGIAGHTFTERICFKCY